MHGRAVEAVRGVRAAHAAGVGPAVDRRAEHEVVDQELRAPVEELGQRLRSVLGLEAVRLLDRDPRQLLPLAGELVAPTGELLLLRQQRDAGGQPLLASSGLHDPISIDGEPPPGWVSPGTLAGDTPTQTTSATNATASGVASRAPCGSTFSAKIATATSAIQKRLITPSTNKTAIRPPEQPTQSRPCASPLRRALSGCPARRQRRRLLCFKGVSS